jgi:hypothetical protein
MKKLLTLIVFFAIFAIPNLATSGEWGWSYSNYSHGSYVPPSGTFSEYCSNGDYVSTVTFEFDSNNVSSIIQYNQGNATVYCVNKDAYLTVDMSAVPQGIDLEIDAYLIYSNLPNPKYDLESDWMFSPDCEESETVALGTVNASSYIMRTWWDDERDGDVNDGGNIQVQFGMSNKGVFDYNNCAQSSPGPEVINSYSDNYGSN